MRKPTAKQLRSVYARLSDLVVEYVLAHGGVPQTHGLGYTLQTRLGPMGVHMHEPLTSLLSPLLFRCTLLDVAGGGL